MTVKTIIWKAHGELFFRKGWLVFTIPKPTDQEESDKQMKLRIEKRSVIAKVRSGYIGIHDILPHVWNVENIHDKKSQLKKDMKQMA